jgi:cbb3-type cytochrome oxidase subunit 3
MPLRTGNFFFLSFIQFLFPLIIFHVVQPAKRHAYAQGDNKVFTPVERELIFDIVSFSGSSLLPKPLDTFSFLTFVDLFFSWWAIGYDRL